MLEIRTVMHACMRVVDVIFSSLGAQYTIEYKSNKTAQRGCHCC
jgi:hypothetical protein